MDVISEGACGRFLVKGYVEGEQTAGGNGTSVELSIKAGMLRDCAGDVFPAASAAGTVSDRCLTALLSATKSMPSACQPYIGAHSSIAAKKLHKWHSLWCALRMNHAARRCHTQ